MPLPCHRKPAVGTRSNGSPCRAIQDDAAVARGVVHLHVVAVDEEFRSAEHFVCRVGRQRHRQWSEVVGRFEWLPDGVDTLWNRSNVVHVLRGWVVYADAVSAVAGDQEVSFRVAQLPCRLTIGHSLYCILRLSLGRTSTEVIQRSDELKDIGGTGLGRAVHAREGVSSRMSGDLIHFFPRAVPG